MILDPLEEEADWVPLDSMDHDSHQVPNVDSASNSGLANTVDADSSMAKRHVEITSVGKYRGRNAALKTLSSSTDTSINFESTLKAIQVKHEMKQSVTENLVCRPLRRLPGLFLKYLVLEIWNHHYYIRFGKL
jgi:hypothetical protein